MDCLLFFLVYITLFEEIQRISKIPYKRKQKSVKCGCEILPEATVFLTEP